MEICFLKFSARTPFCNWRTPKDILFISKFAICCSDVICLNHFNFLMLFLLLIAIEKFIEHLADLIFMFLISGKCCLFTGLCLSSANDWETKELRFNSLQELRICGLNGADCDFAFVKRLSGWAPVLRTITIIFDPSAVVNEELCKQLLGLSGPETCMKIYLYRNGAKVMYTPAG